MRISTTRKTATTGFTRATPARLVALVPKGAPLRPPLNFFLRSEDVEDVTFAFSCEKARADKERKQGVGEEGEWPRTTAKTRGVWMFDVGHVIGRRLVSAIHAEAGASHKFEQHRCLSGENSEMYEVRGGAEVQRCRGAARLLSTA